MLSVHSSAPSAETPCPEILPWKVCQVNRFELVLSASFYFAGEDDDFHDVQENPRVRLTRVVASP